MADEVPTELLRTEIDFTVPHSARTWDWFLGGKDNFTPDRELGQQILQVLPDVREAARADREFLVRTVSHLVTEAGVRQFLDLGTGLPTANNTHQVAQRLASDARIVYVDNDPMVLAHARALLVGTSDGATDYLHADVGRPTTVLSEASRTLDFSAPIAIMMLGILQFIIDDAHARRTVATLLESVPSGSYLAIAHPVAGVDAKLDEAIRMWNEQGIDPQQLRTPEEIAVFFDGMELLEPGVVPCPQWRPDPARDTVAADAAPWRVCGVARKR